MRHADLSQLRELVSDVVAKSTLGGHLRGVALDADHASDADEFLRVLVEVDSFEGVSDEDMESLSASIENAVTKIDERFASVRFAEAA